MVGDSMPRRRQQPDAGPSSSQQPETVPSSLGQHDPPVDPPVDHADDELHIQGNLSFIWFDKILLFLLLLVYFNIFFVDGSGRVRSRRGPTLVRDVWQMREGERIIVECNQLDQPIKKAASLLTSFLGTLARRPELCPLNYAKWNDMLPTYKVELLRIVQVKN